MLNRKEAKHSGHGVIWCTVAVLEWREWGKPRGPQISRYAFGIWTWYKSEYLPFELPCSVKPKPCWTLHVILRNTTGPVERLESCQCFSLQQMVNISTLWVLDSKLNLHRRFLGVSRLRLTIRRVAILTDVSYFSSVSWGILGGGGSQI